LNRPRNQSTISSEIIIPEKNTGTINQCIEALDSHKAQTTAMVQIAQAIIVVRASNLVALAIGRVSVLGCMLAQPLTNWASNGGFVEMLDISILSLRRMRYR
jgi:hypothetical protein